MARRAAASRPPSPPARPALLQRIADLAGRAVTPDRMRREMTTLVTDLLSGTGKGERIAINEQLAELVDQLGEGVDAAREAAGDLDREDRAGLRHAEATVAVLRAAHEALAAACLRF